MGDMKGGLKTPAMAVAGLKLVSRYDIGWPLCLIMQWSSTDLRLSRMMQRPQKIFKWLRRLSFVIMRLVPQI